MHVPMLLFGNVLPEALLRVGPFDISQSERRERCEQQLTEAGEKGARARRAAAKDRLLIQVVGWDFDLSVTHKSCDDTLFFFWFGMFFVPFPPLKERTNVNEDC